MTGTISRDADAARALRSRVVDALYHAATEPGAWPGLLALLVEATDSRSARLLVLNETADQVHTSLKHNIDDSAHQAYVNHFVNACPWRPELKFKQPGRLYSTYLDFSCAQPDYYRTEFYNDWARNLDIHHGLCGTVARLDGQQVQLLLQRTAGQGHYDRTDQAWVNGLVPHLQRALQIATRFEQLQAEVEGAGMAASRNGLAFALTDARGAVRYLSPAAERLLDRESNLELRGGQLRAGITSVDTKLRRLLRQAAISAQGDWHHAGGRVEVPRPGRTPLWLLVSPMHPETRLSTLLATANCAVVFFHDPEQAVCLDHGALRRLYDLTDAEARVAAAVAAGMEPAAIADTQGVSTHTVRSQIKSIFRKTGTRRQTQLASVLLTGPARRDPITKDAPAPAAS